MKMHIPSWLKLPHSLPIWIARLHLATTFLTRLPVPPVCMDKAQSLALAMGLFPLVGAAIGGLGGVIYLLLGSHLGPLTAALCALAAMAVVTGALHEDGLADFADGLGAKGDAEKRLSVMRDPHMGTFGVLALIFAMGLKVSVVSQSPGGWAGLSALAAAGALSRAIMPLLMQVSPPARADGLAVMAGVPDFSTVALGLTLGLLITLGLTGVEATLLALAASVIVGGLVGWLAKRTLGGYTGDVLGAVQQTTEIAILMAVAVSW